MSGLGFLRWLEGLFHLLKFSLCFREGDDGSISRCWGLMYGQRMPVRAFQFGNCPRHDVALLNHNQAVI